MNASLLRNMTDHELIARVDRTDPMQIELSERLEERRAQLDKARLLLRHEQECQDLDTIAETCF